MVWKSSLRFFSVDFFTRYVLFILNHFTLHFSRAHWKRPFSSSSLCNQSWGQCRYWSNGIPSQPQLKTYRSLSQNFPALLASRLLKCSEDHFLCHGIQKEFRNSSHSRCFLAKKHAGHRDTQGGWTELARTEFNTRASIFPIKVYIWSQKCWHGTVSKSFSIFLQPYLNQDIYWCQFLTQVVSWLGGITLDAAHSSSKELILRLEVGLVWCHQPR